MSLENEKYIATRAIIVNEDNKVLLGRRARGSGQGQLALIGGKLDDGETLEQCVVREVAEEIGLRFVDPVLFIQTADNKTIPEQTWHVTFYSGSGEGEINLKKDEVTEIIFAGEEDLDKLNIAFNYREVLEKFFREKLNKI